MHVHGCVPAADLGGPFSGALSTVSALHRLTNIYFWHIALRRLILHVARLHVPQYKNHPCRRELICEANYNVGCRYVSWKAGASTGDGLAWAFMSVDCATLDDCKFNRIDCPGTSSQW